MECRCILLTAIMLAVHYTILLFGTDACAQNTEQGCCQSFFLNTKTSYRNLLKTLKQIYIV
jgi:hypothetical protein